MTQEFEIHRRGVYDLDKNDEQNNSESSEDVEDIEIINQEEEGEYEENEEEYDSEENEEKDFDIYDEILKALSKISYYCVHIIILVMFLMNLFFTTPQYALIYYFPRSLTNGMQIFYGYLFFCTAYFLIKAKRTPVTNVKPTHYSEEEESYCFECDQPKYKRVHHCSTCNQCVVRMDHHCSFIDSCVGLHNLRYFFVFLFYATILCLFQLSQIIILSYHHNKLPSSKFMLLIIDLLVAVGCTVGVVFLFIAQFVLITFNMTLIEFYNMLNVASSSLPPNKYYISIIDNWCEAFMVDKLWKLPFKFLPFT